jgi:hypothetical protein
VTAIPSDPHAVVAAMIAAGWERVGGRADSYVRLCWPNNQRTTVVPLGPNNPEYGDPMGAVIAELAQSAADGASAKRVLEALSTDEVGLGGPGQG